MKRNINFYTPGGQYFAYGLLSSNGRQYDIYLAPSGQYLVYGLTNNQQHFNFYRTGNYADNHLVLNFHSGIFNGANLNVYDVQGNYIAYAI